MTPERRTALVRQLTWQLTAMAASTGWGPDIDWIGSDRDGHLAVFATAGLGPIPARVTRDPDGLVAVFEDIENLKAVEFKLEGFTQDPAHFGAFAFDYSGEGKAGMGQYVAGHAYERLRLIPTEPLSVESFAAEAANYLRDVRFAEVCFVHSSGIVVEDAFAEIYRPTDWDQWSRPELLRPVAPRPKPPVDEAGAGPA